MPRQFNKRHAMAQEVARSCIERALSGADTTVFYVDTNGTHVVKFIAKRQGLSEGVTMLAIGERVIIEQGHDLAGEAGFVVGVTENPPVYKVWIDAQDRAVTVEGAFVRTDKAALEIGIVSVLGVPHFVSLDTGKAKQVAYDLAHRIMGDDIGISTSEWGDSYSHKSVLMTKPLVTYIALKTDDEYLVGGMLGMKGEE